MQPTGNTQRLASRIADAIARGRAPGPTPALEAFLAGPIEEIYAVLDAFERHLATGTERTLDLAEAYLNLMQLRLEHLRYDVDANYDWAKEQARAFQQTVAEHARTGRIDGAALALIGRALHEAKLEPIPELIAAGGELPSARTEAEIRDLPREAEGLMQSIVEQAGEDPFAICEVIAQCATTLPPQARSAAASLFLSRGQGTAQQAAALMILDGSAEIRHAIALALLAHAHRMSPPSLRRLISLRNWLPETDHHFVDQVVRAARESGIECPAWQSRPAAAIHASALDGAGVQGFLIVSPEGKRQRLSSVLVKRAKGIQEAWCREARKGEVSQSLRFAAAEGMLQTVSREYLDLVVQHYLAVGRNAGNLPPVALLQLAETLGGAGWQPSELEWRNALDGLLRDVPPAELTEAAVSRTLDQSAAWSEVGTAESWFEDDQEVADLIAGTRSRTDARLSEYVLRTVVERRASKWAEHFVWVALWLRHIHPSPDARWKNFAVLARAVADGRGIADIPLMRAIADRTVVALAFARPSSGTAVSRGR